jgi:hypothetical protein
MAAFGSPPLDLYRTLADSLLFGRATIASATGTDIGTRSMRARSEYARAHAALETWDLRAADSLFAAATGSDDDFVRAHLWLAQVRNWLGLPPEHWANHAEIAGADTLSLNRHERLLAAGLASLGRRQYPAACESFAALAELAPRDFSAWHGLGDCLSRDNVVVPDRASPSGFRFRASYHRAVEAYRTAFRILPSSHLTVRSGGLERISDQLWTAPRKLRVGRSEGGDRPEFVAHPALVGDTLVFVPHPWDLWDTAEGSSDVTAWSLATDRQREVMSDVARRWVAAYPRSPEAAYAQAVALDLLGDPASIDWVRRARSLEPASTRSIDFAAAQVWLEFRYGAPDTARIATARILADSLLATAADDSSNARRLAPIALLIGRPSHAARLAATVSMSDAPAAVSRPANALLAFASIGAPVDSIRFYERQTIEGIRNAMPTSEHQRARGLVLEQPGRLAFPAHILESLRTDSMRTAAGIAQAAWLRGDSMTLDALMPRLRTPPDRAAERAPEIQYASARFLAIAGDTATAILWLDGFLGSLRWFTPDTFESLADAGVVGRAMALRARLAQQQNDDVNARRWGRAVAALWATAEPAARAAALRLDASP